MKKLTQREEMAYSTIARLEAELAQAKVGGWIKCSDRLPEYNQNVLVCFETLLKTQQITTAELNHQKRCSDPASTDFDEVWYVTVGRGHKIKPTHWQPLPAAPTE